MRDPLDLGPFRLEAPLARGGMGEVWRAVHVRQQVPVAVKVLRHDVPHERLVAEVRAVARLDHPGVILVLDHGVAPPGIEAATEGRLRPGSPWLAMELCTGGTLHDAPVRAWPAFRKLLLDMLAALAHAHARGVLHRDLKPENVLFSAFEDVRPGLKLTDWGLATAIEADRRFVVGTPAYMAPEQFRRAEAEQGPWTDLYSLGCLAWKVATGSAPYGESRPPEVLAMAHQELPLPPFKPRFPTPAGLEEWLRRVLEKDCVRRTQRAADAAAALENLDGSRALGGFVPADWRAAEPPRVPMRLLGAGLGLYAVRTLPVVNRRAERDRLWASLLDAQSEWSARLVLLHGPAGVGKTRLAEWLVERAHETGAATVLDAEHAPEGGDALARMVDQLAWPAAAGERAAFHAAKGPAGRRAALRALLERLCGERPVVVRLEDVQWGDEALSFVEDVMRAQDASPLPVLFVLTARSEALAERPAEAQQLSTLMGLGGPCTWLEVRPLAPPDQVQLVEGLLGLAGELAERVRVRAAGNPAFAVRLVGDWVGRGILEPSEDGFVLRAGARAELPDDVHALWASRLRRALEPLGPGAGPGAVALQLAAALGSEVDEGEWRAACRAADVEVPDMLVERLTVERLVVPVERGGEELVWAFANGMMRESLERDARDAGRLPALHRACAATLLGRPDAPALAERLGRHFLAANAPADALPFLLAGAREQAGDGDPRAAASLLAARDEALRGLGVPASDARWAEGRLMDARLLLRQGRTDAAEARADALLADARRHDWAAWLPDALLVRAEVARARGEPMACAELAVQARELWARQGNERAAAQALLLVGEVAALGGELARAMRLLQQAQAVLARGGDPRPAADCLRLRADVARRSGALDAAAELLAQAQVRYARLGWRLGRARGLVIAADLSRAHGDLDAATLGYRDALHLFEASGAAEAVLPLTRLGSVLVAQGRPREAAQVLEVALRMAERGGQRPEAALAHAWLLAVTAAARELASWDAHHVRLLELLSSGIADPDVAAAAEATAGLLPRDPGRARRALDLARAQWTLLGADAKVRAVDAALARLPT